MFDDYLDIHGRQLHCVSVQNLVPDRLPWMDLVIGLHSWSTHNPHRSKILDPVLPSSTLPLSSSPPCYQQPGFPHLEPFGDHHEVFRDPR